MSEGVNRVTLLGNIGADPELKVTTGGQSVLKIRLATNESYLDRDKVRQERTEWHRVTLWGKRAESLGKMLRKGEPLFVEGRLQTSSYEKDGEKRYSTEVVATNIVLIGGKQRGDSAPHDDAPPARAPRAAPAAVASDFDGNDDLPF